MVKNTICIFNIDSSKGGVMYEKGIKYWICMSIEKIGNDKMKTVMEIDYQKLDLEVLKKKAGGESEVKIFDVESDSLTARLNNLGAQCTFHGNRQVSVYDTKDTQIINGDQLLRLTVSDSAKLTLHINQSNYSEKRVVKVAKISNHKLNDLITRLNNLGYFPMNDVMTQRIAFELPGIDSSKVIKLNIDIFPEIPAFLEIDLETLKDSGYTLESLLNALGLSSNKTGSMGTEDIHSMYGKDYFKVYSVNKEKKH